MKKAYVCIGTTRMEGKTYSNFWIIYTRQDMIFTSLTEGDVPQLTDQDKQAYLGIINTVKKFPFEFKIDFLVDGFVYERPPFVKDVVTGEGSTKYRDPDIDETIEIKKLLCGDDFVLPE
ncbi:MAG: hypothetical protein JW754_04750 [Candidatus Aenigmarchaeota archaeon]|nr:hypothetical protein [Candidatus Aenigmarchaeota archaeon]